jgi:tetratricopeptide (TPR) repeat protein
MEKSPSSQMQMNWDYFKFNPDTNSFDAYIQFYNQVAGGTVQSLLVQKLSEQARFPREKKLETYRELLSNATSLKVLSRTQSIIDSEAHLNLNILGTPLYLQWVHHQLNLLLITNCTEAIQTNKNDVKSYIMRAIYNSYETNYDNALKDFKTALSINPTNSDALNAYAWFISVCPDGSVRNGRLAVELATQACELTNWKQWNNVGTLAAAYAEAGDYEKAIKYENQAIETAGISEKDSNKEKARLTLFEQNKPTHEIQDWVE